MALCKTLWPSATFNQRSSLTVIRPAAGASLQPVVLGKQHCHNGNPGGIALTATDPAAGASLQFVTCPTFESKDGAGSVKYCHHFKKNLKARDDFLKPAS